MQHAALPRSFIALLPRLMRACALSACVFALAGPALADSYSEVKQLAQTGQATQALAKADAYLQQNPRDPQMRFIRGVILSDQGKTAEATEAFTQLTREYPELPEPYNNLAAIYAAQSQYDKAREALETALRLNPNYVTAHENLGDIYARLAAQQYAKATNYASAGPAVQAKLTHVRQLFEAMNSQGAPAKRAPNAVEPAAPKR
ncbi:tetratricopeptide repeat protein [Xenophilus arseniciresistens]|uniref:Tetratricopeptide repeat protein n=1 Tax=Xenophilus arseniciresistens TaxID=1283306 RepID=A0AAE3SXQ1_9BURK|nr:tetratricopeptide repeat protein [Xenophilus arseniciresistens]MDA7415189.1 tetratricopeptide repeat protein [Xenophilus arseniciresistens]